MENHGHKVRSRSELKGQSCQSGNRWPEIRSNNQLEEDNKIKKRE